MKIYVALGTMDARNKKLNKEINNIKCLSFHQCSLKNSGAVCFVTPCFTLLHLIGVLVILQLASLGN